MIADQCFVQGIFQVWFESNGFSGSELAGLRLRAWCMTSYLGMHWGKHVYTHMMCYFSLYGLSSQNVL